MKEVCRKKDCLNPDLRIFKGCKDRLSSLLNQSFYIYPYILLKSLNPGSDNPFCGK